METSRLERLTVTFEWKKWRKIPEKRTPAIFNTFRHKDCFVHTFATHLSTSYALWPCHTLFLKETLCVLYSDSPTMTCYVIASHTFFHKTSTAGFGLHIVRHLAGFRILRNQSYTTASLAFTRYPEY
ncbi:hypothetical protein KCU87_g234, partial [Aureobasidium melanogenum]